MLVRYIIVGCLATAIFYLVANIFALFSGAYIATFAGNLASFVFGYFAQMKCVFGVQARHSTMLPRYIVLLCLIFAYGQIITFFGKNFSYEIVSLCIALSVPAFSYPLQKFWVFKEVKDDSKVPLGGGGNTLLRRQYLAYFHSLFYFIFYHIYLSTCFFNKCAKTILLSEIALVCIYRFSLLLAYYVLRILFYLRLVSVTRLQNLFCFLSIPCTYWIRIPLYLTHKEL